MIGLHIFTEEPSLKEVLDIIVPKNLSKIPSISKFFHTFVVLTAALKWSTLAPH